MYINASRRRTFLNIMRMYMRNYYIVCTFACAVAHIIKTLHRHKLRPNILFRDHRKNYITTRLATEPSCCHAALSTVQAHMILYTTILYINDIVHSLATLANRANLCRALRHRQQQLLTMLQIQRSTQHNSFKFVAAKGASTKPATQT